jgi:hypothetical protein
MSKEYFVDDCSFLIGRDDYAKLSTRVTFPYILATYSNYNHLVIRINFCFVLIHHYSWNVISLTGECLDHRRVCNGIRDCVEDNGSDERNCTFSGRPTDRDQ